MGAGNVRRTDVGIGPYGSVSWGAVQVRITNRAGFIPAR